MTLQLECDDAVVVVCDGGVELFRYCFMPSTTQLESPKPYLHPVRTRAGRPVSLFRPWDHVWHTGLAWALPVVGDHNFWGGPSYVRHQGYVQLPNNGAQEHRAVVEADSGGIVRFVHDLEWLTECGRPLFVERRALAAHLVDETAWALTFDTAMTSVAATPLRFGSPTTKGRENAGYGGLFWRGPRSFSGGRFLTRNGAGTGNEVRGQRHDWMGFVGRHDGADAMSLILIVDAASNPHHPPQWFARSEEFAALNPAPFFSDELEVHPGETVRFRYAIGIADDDGGAATRLAEHLQRLL